jgi:Fic family protein
LSFSIDQVDMPGILQTLPPSPAKQRLQQEYKKATDEHTKAKKKGTIETLQVKREAAQAYVDAEEAAKAANHSKPTTYNKVTLDAYNFGTARTHKSAAPWWRIFW